MQILELKHKGVKEWQDITATTIMERLLVVMKDHISSTNKVDRDTLFKKVYGVAPDRLSQLNHIVCGYILSAAITKCRQNTYCFISSLHQEGSRYYFVTKTVGDANHYITSSNKRIKSYKKMQRRAVTSVTEKWYKKDWTNDRT